MADEEQLVTGLSVLYSFNARDYKNLQPQKLPSYHFPQTSTVDSTSERLRSEEDFISRKCCLGKAHLQELQKNIANQPQSRFLSDTDHKLQVLFGNRTQDLRKICELTSRINPQSCIDE